MHTSNIYPNTYYLHSIWMIQTHGMLCNVNWKRVGTPKNKLTHKRTPGMHWTWQILYTKQRAYKGGI